jgi:putative intracellular protease/amidase
MTTTGILVFDAVEELDFVGPWEVLTSGKLLFPEHRVVTIGVRAGEVRCAKGLRVVPDHTLDDAPALDVLLVPGGDGTRPLLKDERLASARRAPAGRRASAPARSCSRKRAS